MTESDHDILTRIEQGQEFIIKRLDGVFRTLFGEDGRTGIVKDMNDACRDIGGLKRHVALVWGCIGAVVLAVITAFLGHAFH